MDDDKYAIALGLGAGLGGFAGFLIICCVLWKLCCDTTTSTKALSTIVTKKQLRTKPAVTSNEDALNMKPMNSTCANSNTQLQLSNDLASKVKASRR